MTSRGFGPGSTHTREEPNMTDYLSKKALTITFSVSQWGATAKDKKVTDKALADNHATSDAGKFTKNLLSGDALDPIQKLVGKARAYHREVTLPWKQDGERLLPATLYADYSQKMRGFEISFEALVGEFCSNYEQQVDRRRVDLNGMFRDADYPSLEDVRSKFAWTIRPTPLADVNDFRVELADGHAQQIKAQIEAELNATASEALKDPLRRVVAAVSALATRLTEYKAADGKKSRFSGSLIENVETIANLLPAFNLSGDPQVAALADELKVKLCRETADELKENDHVRKAVAKDAADILARVESLLS